MKKSILYGDLTNLKTSLVQRLEQIYTYLVPREQFSTPELDEELLDLTQQMGREIAVYLNGNGRVMAVSIGDHATVDLPEASVACIHIPAAILPLVSQISHPCAAYLLILWGPSAKQTRERFSAPWDS